MTMPLPEFRFSTPKDHQDMANQINRNFENLTAYLKSLKLPEVLARVQKGLFDAPPFPTTASGSTSGIQAGAGIAVSSSGGMSTVSNMGVIAAAVAGQGLLLSAPTGSITFTTEVKGQRVTTGSVPASGAVDVTLTWAVAFADTNYTAVASVQDLGEHLTVGPIKNLSTTNVIVAVNNNDAGAAHTGTLHVIAIHD